MMLPLPHRSSDRERHARYDEVEQALASLLDGETDATAAMATFVCELHHAFEAFHWTGFYRMTASRRDLVIGPYQGTHGCLRIALDRGVCGAAARLAQTQLVPDVEAFPGHIACSATTRSEIVVPYFVGEDVVGVLDIDSNHPGAFDVLDQARLERLLQRFAPQLTSSR